MNKYMQDGRSKKINVLNSFKTELAFIKKIISNKLFYLKLAKFKTIKRKKKKKSWLRLKSHRPR